MYLVCQLVRFTHELALRDIGIMCVLLYVYIPVFACSPYMGWNNYRSDEPFIVYLGIIDLIITAGDNNLIPSDIGRTDTCLLYTSDAADE